MPLVPANLDITIALKQSVKLWVASGDWSA